MSVWAFPKRRHPGGALDRATAAGFLCGRLRRFGIRAYGIVRCDETPPKVLRQPGNGKRAEPLAAPF